jgi:hypothetical protein
MSAPHAGARLRTRDLEHHGHPAIELIHRGTRVVLVHGIGPRIGWFGAVGGPNLLFWDVEERHREGQWRLYGGHRLWITRPDADESAETYWPDNAPCRVRRLADGVSATAPPDGMGIERTLAVRASGRAWRVEHRLRNAGRMLWSGGAWALTCTLPLRSTRVRIPLDGGTPSWDVVTVVIPRSWGGTHRSRLDDSQIRFTADAMELRSHGREAKRMISAPRGTIELHDHRGTFRKVARYLPGARYPLATNLAVYLGARGFMIELESMSPLHTVAPGHSIVHVETWTLE